MLEKGMMLAERYEILDMIGTGGMSDVYKAMDTSLNREVAIKVLKDEFVTDNAFVSKFRAEASAAAGLEHPNIVNIYDVGNEDGRHFIVMEYIEGVTLKTYIAKKGHLSTNELLSVAIQVGRGIEAAHNKSIIHRDIKPQNVIISREGKVKVTDFGIARAVTSNTINADRMGSVHYSSPEQTRNGFVTYQSDIYSLGIVMYEMCTGEVPFDGDTTVAIALKHLQSEMIPPGDLVDDVPVSVEKIILKATMKSPERRYESMSDMLTDLKKALISPNEDFVYIPPMNSKKDISEKSVSKNKKHGSSDESKNPIKKKLKDKEREKRNDKRRDIEDTGEIDDGTEGEVSRKMDKAVTIMGIAAAVVIILIVIYLLGSFFGLFSFGRGGNSATTSSISGVAEIVPDVMGLTEEEARKAIEEKGFIYKKIGEASSEEYEEGKVMDQMPKGKEKASKGSTVSVTISSGEGNVDIPSVVGMSQDQAMKIIKDANFLCNIQQEYSANVDQGKVIRQTPEAKTKGNEGDTITIWISRGKELASVPGVVNYTQDEAVNALQRAGFNVNVYTENSDVETGRVIRQSVTGQAQPGSSVDIVVSLGPAKVYYRFEKAVSSKNGEGNHLVLCDSTGAVISGAVWDITAAGGTIRAQNLPVAEGILIYYAADGSTELARESVTFTKQ